MKITDIKIVGFNFDIDLSVWDHTVITEENRFYIGIKMPDGLYHSFHGINKNGNVGTLLYVHGNENARYIESEDCITISELTEKFIKAEISFDKALDIVKKKKIIYAPDATMQAMLSDKKGRVLIIEPGIGYRYEQENFSLITNYSILKPDITKPYIVSGDTRYEVAKELLAGYDKDFSVNDAFKVLKSVSQKLKRVVKGIVRNYRKELKRRRNKEISYCELPEIVVEKLAVWDEYESDYTAFDVCGIEVRVLDDDLAEAIKYLSEKDREILLMYFFLGMSDTEIGDRLKINRSTSFRSRKNSLEEIKKKLKENMNDE